MNYQETLDYLYSALPMYQRVGPQAFKKDLANTLALCKALGNPQHKFKSVHVAGTNGKGSSSHSIAAVLQMAGYKVGLYTSPHLKSFTERIRLNGQEIPEANVVSFVADNKAEIERIQPSFFEMTVVMAFDYFAKANVDIAVIEVGLGGRLDSTNVITPEVSLITNIGYDHMDMLGDTLEKIAFEKAGIIKEDVPVVIGTTQDETTPVFETKAKSVGTPLIYADQDDDLEFFKTDLMGPYHQNNLPGILKTIEVLTHKGFYITKEAAIEGLGNVAFLTGIKGRWQVLSDSPLIIADTGHNKEAFQFIVDEIRSRKWETLYMVLGFVEDKNVLSLLEMIPTEAEIVFCEANVPRAMKLEKLKSLASHLFPNAHYVKDVNKAVETVSERASKADMIFIGGSTFVVAELNDL